MEKDVANTDLASWYTLTLCERFAWECQPDLIRQRAAKRIICGSPFSIIAYHEPEFVCASLLRQAFSIAWRGCDCPPDLMPFQCPWCRTVPCITSVLNCSDQMSSVDSVGIDSRRQQISQRPVVSFSNQSSPSHNAPALPNLILSRVGVWAKYSVIELSWRP